MKSFSISKLGSFGLQRNGRRETMNHRILITVYFCLLFCSPRTESKLTAVVTVFKTAIDIFKTGFQIVNFIRKLNSDPKADLKNMLEEIRKDMTRMISSSTTAIIREITLQNKLEKIEDTVSEIRSLLIDLENYIDAENEVDRQAFKNLFLERFDQRVAAMIRKLPTFLTFTVPGFSEPLIELIRDKANCNMTAIHEFQMFYVNLLADASTLQLVFRELSDLPSDDVEKFWKGKLPSIQLQFDNMEASCKKRFPKSAAQEIKQDIDASTLYKDCKQRYTWAFCVVLYYAPMGTHQFHYHKSVSDLMFWNGASSSGRNQIAVIGDIVKAPKTWNNGAMNSALKANVSSFKVVISDSEDVSAALKVGVAVEKFIKNKGFGIKGVVVFFDATALGTTSRIVDDSSPAAYVLVRDVTLKYCYSSGFVCTFARWSWFNFNDDWKVYTGRFHVYVFPCESNDDCSTHSTSAAFSRLRSFPFPGLFFCFVYIAFLAVSYIENILSQNNICQFL